jgi:hypothetical protein
MLKGPPLISFLQQPELYTADELRKLATWYRTFAERAGDPRIWEARLLTAEKLQAEADRLEAQLTATGRDRGAR